MRLTLVDCRPFNEKGMTLLFELKGDSSAKKRVLAGMRKIEGVRQIIAGEGSGDTCPLLVVTDRPAVCRALNDSAIICLQCPLSSTEEAAAWKFIVRRSSDLNRVLSSMTRDGVDARIEEVSPMEERPSLTDRQKEIMCTAVSRGFFEFPRRISLTELSDVAGVKPSTLSEILRGAERRIMESALGPSVSDSRWVGLEEDRESPTL